MPLSPRFDAALDLASDLHAEQRRKGSGVPYVAHLLAVTALVLEHGGTEDEAIAALLHDAVEDQGGRRTLELIRSRFGDSVAGMVEACSDAHGWPRPPWRGRKERFLATLPAAEPGVRLIMAADKLHNVQSIVRELRAGKNPWIKFTGGRDGTLWYYRTALEVLRVGGEMPILEELAQAVTELDHLAALSPFVPS